MRCFSNSFFQVIRRIKFTAIIFIIQFTSLPFAQAEIEIINLPTNQFIYNEITNFYSESYWPSLQQPIAQYGTYMVGSSPVFSANSISQDWKDSFFTYPGFPGFNLSSKGGYTLSFTFELKTGWLWCRDSLNPNPLSPRFDPGIYTYNIKPNEHGGASVQCNKDFGGGSAFSVILTNIKLSREKPVETPKKIAPTDSVKGQAICANSTVNSDTLALHENISLVGAPFYLSYASDRLRPDSAFSPKALGLGGWTASLVQRYVPAQKGIYFGDGSYRNVEAVSSNGAYYATDSSGSEIYYFDANGIHTSTKDSLTGVTSYSFAYDSTGRLSSITDKFGKTSSITYSAALTLITSPYGQTTELKFDSNGFLASVKNPNNETFALVNSTEGYLTSFTKPGGQTSHVIYDTNGYVTKDTGAGGDFISLVRTFDNTTSTQKVILSSALGRKTEFTTISSEAGKSIHKVISPDGRSNESNSQDKISENSVNSTGENSQSAQAQDPRFGWMAPFAQSSSRAIANSNVSVFTQVSKTADLADINDPFSFTKLTQRTILQNDSSKAYLTEYDKPTRTIKSLSPLGRVNYTVLNELGQIGIIQQASLEAVYFSYDSFGRISSIKQGNRISYLVYDNLGNLEKIQDSLGRITSFKYDLSGRITEQIRPDQKSIRFTHDANGNVTSITPADSQTHQFSFNLFELTDTYTPPTLVDEIATHYSYNLDKQLTKVQRPDGKEINFNYNAQTGKLDSLAYPEGAASFSYLPTTGQLVSTLTSENIRSDFSYQGPLLQGTVLSIGSLQLKMNYSYQADGQLSSLSLTPGNGVTSSIAVTYDKDNSPITIGAESLSYDQQNGFLKGSALGFISESISRNKFGEMTSVNYNFNDNIHVSQSDNEDDYCSDRSSVYAYNLSRDPSGRITAKTEQFRGKHQDTINYIYDTLGRLTEVKNDKKTIYYQYDSNGNRLRRIEGREIIPARYDAQDRLIKYGDTDFSYNANGDLIAKYNYGRKEQDGSRPPRYDEKEKKKQVTQYFYDSLGNLKKVILPSGKVIEYLIDAQNRRVGKKINGKIVQLFMYQSQLQVSAELDGQGELIRHFVYGSKSNIPDYFIQAGVKYKIISDHLGSPRLIINSDTGKIMAKMNYDEFGLATEMSYKNKMTSLPFGFAGGLYDEDTELSRFGARDYMPEVGRWTSKDPIGFGGGDTNLYGYVVNNPINNIDLTGLTKEDVLRAIAIAEKEFSRVKGLSPSFVDFNNDDETVGRTIYHLFGNSELQLHSKFLGVLTDADKLDLLNTVLHEAKHVQDGFWGNLYGELTGGWDRKIRDWQYHVNIYINTSDLVEKYKNEFLCEK